MFKGSVNLVKYAAIASDLTYSVYNITSKDLKKEFKRLGVKLKKIENSYYKIETINFCKFSEK